MPVPLICDPGFVLVQELRARGAPLFRCLGRARGLAFLERGCPPNFTFGAFCLQAQRSPPALEKWQSRRNVGVLSAPPLCIRLRRYAGK